MAKNHNKEHLERYHKQRKEAIEYLGSKCSKCGSVYELEIDHINWKDKTLCPGKDWGYTEAWWKEIKDRCQLLCRDCHKEKTKKDLSERNMKDRSLCHGTLSQYMRYKCRCDKCKEVYSKWRRESRQTQNSYIKGPYSKNPKHGTTAKYSKGCRCDQCRAANAAKARRLRNS